MTPRKSIAIVGAGIGGLAAAALLYDHGHTVQIFDQFDTPRPVGSGLVIQPVGQAVLDAVGAGSAARAKGRAIKRMLGHEADRGRCVLNVWYDRTGEQQTGLAIHGASLFSALYDAVTSRGIRIEGGSHVETYQTGMLHMTGGAADGPFDLVVDSAGARSTLSPLQGRPLPYGAIWGTVDWPDTDLPPNQLTQVYRRADRMIGVLPIGCMPGDDGPKAAIFWSLPQDDHKQWQDTGVTAWSKAATEL